MEGPGQGPLAKFQVKAPWQNLANIVATHNTRVCRVERGERASVAKALGVARQQGTSSHPSIRPSIHPSIYPSIHLPILRSA